MPSPAGGLSYMAAASPMSSANTPQMEPPGSQEDREYIEKVRQLSKYIEPLREMIARIGNEDQIRLDKMKKLMDILSNPNKRMSLEVLLRCENVLSRMNFDFDSSSAQGSSAAGEKQQQSQSASSSSYPMLEAIANLKGTKAGGQPLNHTLKRAFGVSLEAMYGSDITLPPLPKKRKPEKKRESDNLEASDLLQGEIARLQRHFQVQRDPVAIAGSRQGISVLCKLDDPNLPAVPPLTVTIPHNYPEEPPSCRAFLDDGLATPFLQRIQEGLNARLDCMPERFTLSQLLSAWETSVRAACSPSSMPEVSRPALLMGL